MPAHRSLLLCACLALAITACKTTTPATQAPAAPTAVETPAPALPADQLADDNLNAVLWVQRSVEYRALAEQTYRAATGQLDQALRQHWDAIVPDERVAGTGKRSPAVVLDVDETVLDNSPYQARLVRDGKEFDEVSWDAWVEEKKAKAVPGVVAFAKAANARGITLVYISNRAVHLKDATIANLRAVGLPVADESVFLGLGTFVKDCEQNGTEKNCRRQLAGQKYRVLMQFGDQLGDFAQVVANTEQGRDALMAQYDSWFGQRWWMLPGPTYGSWEPALFNNDWAQPREARRAAKRARLDTAP